MPFDPSGTFLAWSPDSRYLVFNSRAKGPSSLARRAVDGTGAEQQLTSADRGQRAPVPRKNSLRARSGGTGHGDTTYFLTHCGSGMNARYHRAFADVSHRPRSDRRFPTVARPRRALPYAPGRRESLSSQAVGILRRAAEEAAPPRRRHATHAGRPRPIHRLAAPAHGCATGDAPAMAPSGLSPGLAVEVTAPWPSAASHAPAGIDRGDGACESHVG